MAKVLTPISIDSPVLFSLAKEKGFIRVKGFLQLNSSLTKIQTYIIEMKKLIRNFSTQNKSLFKRQLKQELLTYEVYTTHIANEKQKQRTNLEN